MKTFLEKFGYVLDPNKGIWRKPGYRGISYSDGAETESRIATIVEGASDLTVLSSELRRHCTDWPSLYHLSGSRADILRPFTASLSGNILEIGAGCGAITRYLGECGGRVLALEGSLRRAAIARSRTRDLKNVTVLAEKFDEFQSDRRFDVITLIGVLEYANLFTAGETPALAMLRRVRSLLAPDGMLLIAIENQLGLKYFAGAPEDHLGQPMVGIEGRYRNNQPQTFGRKALSDMLKQTGFPSAEFLAPFPDYKLPASIVTEAGFKSEDFDAAVFAWQSARRDPHLPPYCNFSLELAWPWVLKNGLGLDVANSFLIVAAREARRFFEPAVLAYHYSTNRRSEYCKETLFRRVNANDIEVRYKRLHAPETSARESEAPVIKFVCPESEKYILGTPLSLDFVHLATKDDCSIDQVADFVRRYLKIIETIAKEQHICCDMTSPHSTLPGWLCDVVPQNIILRKDGSAALIDREWELLAPLELGHLLWRSLLMLMASVSRFGSSMRGPTNLTRRQFVDRVLLAAGMQLGDQDYSRYAQREAAKQEQVTGILTAEFHDWLPELHLPTFSLHQVVAERTRRISTLDAQIKDKEVQIANMERLVRVKDQYIKNLEKSITLKTDQINHFERAVFDKDVHIAELGKAVWEKDVQIADMGRAVDTIYHSEGWKFLTYYYKIRDRTLPSGSLRRGFAKKVLIAFKNIIKKIQRRHTLI